MTQYQMLAPVRRRHRRTPIITQMSGASGIWQRSPMSSGQCHFPSVLPQRKRGRKVQRLVIKLFPLPPFSQSADKRAVQCKANSPQPTGYRLDDREQIKQKDECSLRGSGSISDSSDPSFYPPLPLPFLLPSLALILLLKVTAGNTETLRAEVQSSVFFG